MEYKNEHQRRMAILEASLPYVAPGSRHAFELLLQADALIQLANHTGESDLEAAAASGNAAPFHPNPQEMLLNIQKFLTPRESDIVQTILNFMNAQKLFQNYSEFVHSQSGAAEESTDFSAAATSNTTNPIQVLFQLINGLGSMGRGLSAASSGSDHTQQNMLQEFLFSQLNPEQKATFEQLQNIMYNE